MMVIKMMKMVAGKEAEETQQGCRIDATVCCSFHASLHCWRIATRTEVDLEGYTNSVNDHFGGCMKKWTKSQEERSGR